MYPYHNKAKQLIKQNLLIRWEIVEKWNHIEQALVLYFDNHRPIPIRPHRHEEYFKLIQQLESNPAKTDLS